jgi:hypothetical protein
MFGLLLTPLSARLGVHFPLSKSRLATLGVLIVGLVNGRTINLSHLATQFPGDALHVSNYRRLQRFFQHTHLDGDVLARLVIEILGQGGQKYLALDRTTWKLGKRAVNVLVLAVVTRRFRVPILWVCLGHGGCSSVKDRTDLLTRYLKLFGVSSITVLLADREFVGTEWLEFLLKNNVPFAIRLKEDRKFLTEDGRLLSLRTRLLKHKRGVWSGWLHGMDHTPETRVHIVAKRLKAGEALFIVTNIDNPKRALSAYRKRWAIECLFSDAKTRGLNLEDTHMTDPGKLETVFAVITLAIAWAYRCATKQMGRKAIPRKTHGRREKSWFRSGLDTLRNWIINKPDKAIAAWAANCPKRLVT